MRTRNTIIILATACTLLSLGLYFFGYPAKKPGSNPGQMAKNGENPAVQKAHSFQEILEEIYTKMPPEKVQQLKNQYVTYNTATTTDAKIKALMPIKAYWSDTANLFEPFAHAESELAQLVNSEKNLTFAARLIFDRLEMSEGYHDWMAAESRKLFEKALLINPNNDSNKVSLGAISFFEPNNTNPMGGIQKILEVVNTNTSFAYGYHMLGVGNTINGQLDKAVERYQASLAINPNQPLVIERLGKLYEKLGEKQKAAEQYTKLLPLFNKSPEIKKEIEEKIKSLNK
jgi:tetratricopeptide (TPR) repeat protein